MPLVVALALVGSGYLFRACGPGFDPPQSDSCRSPENGNITGVELVIGDNVVASGATVSTVVGGQGTDMLPVKFNVAGTQLPECISHRSAVYCTHMECNSDIDVGLSTVPLKTYENGSGRQTGTAYIILDRSPFETVPVRVETTIGGTMQTWTLNLEF